MEFDRKEIREGAIADFSPEVVGERQKRRWRRRVGEGNRRVAARELRLFLVDFRKRG
jgi:hypothetical protein